MAVELARAYVQIVPSMRGMQPALTKELDGVARSQGVAGAGRRLGSRLSSAMGTALKTGVVATGAAVGGTLATALTKGFGRLRAFEQAEQSLKGMGLAAADVALVMENANAAVDGTAYGLDAAATAAKGLVTAGMRPGEDLQRVLTLVADSAAQAGTSMDEMGLIWQKVYAKGRLQGDEAMQLMERGIPIYQMVADQLGITAEEAMKLGEQSQISFEMFADAMETNFSGSAQAMGETVTGSFANVGAALGRLGQGILAGPFADLPGLFTRIRDGINAITPAVTDMSARTYAAIKGISEVLSGTTFSPNMYIAFGDHASDVTASLQVLRGGLDDVRGAFSGFGAAVSRELEPLSRITFADTLAAFERLSRFATSTVTGLVNIGTALVPVAANIGQAGMVLGGGVLVAVERLAPAFLTLGQAVAAATAPLSGLLVPAAEIAVGAVLPLVEALGSLVEWAAGFPAPVLAAGAALVMFRRHSEGVTGAVTAFKGALDTLKLRHHLAQMQGLSGGAAIVQGAMLRAKGAVQAFGAALVANAPMLALTALVGVITAFTGASQKAKQNAEDLSRSFDDLGNATDQTRDKLYDMLEDDDLPARFEKIGISTREVSDVLLEGGQAVEDFKARLQTLRDAAIAAGDFELARELKNLTDAIGKQSKSVDESKVVWQRRKEATEDAAVTENRLADAIQGVIDAEKARQDQLLSAQNAQLAAREAQRSYTQAVEQAMQVMADESATMADREAALDNIARETQRVAVAAAEAGAGQDELNTIIAQGKTDFEQAALAAGLNAAQVEELWRVIGLNPGDVTTRMHVDAMSAWTELGRLKIGIDETSGLVTIDGQPMPGYTKLAELEGAINNGDGTVTIAGNRYPADQTLDSFLIAVSESSEYANILGRNEKAQGVLAATLTAIRNGEEYVNVNGKDRKARDVLRSLQRHIQATSGSVNVGANAKNFNTWVDGVDGKTIATSYVSVREIAAGRHLQTAEADGGLVDFYARGGLRESHVAQIAPAGTWRVWAEPETGGEAYIPLAVSKRERSTRILAEVADRFGYQLQKYADGGFNPRFDNSLSHSRSSGGGVWDGLPRTVVLQVGEAEFTGYLSELADRRVNANPGVQAANDFVNHYSRYSAQLGGV